MIPTLAVALVLGPSVPDGQWGPTTLTHRALAAKIDNRLATLSRARLRYEYSYVKEAVGQGYVDCTGAIAAPGVFRVDLPNINPKRQMVIQREVWISDGKRFAKALGQEPMASQAIPRPPANPHPLSNWFSDFSRVILSGLGRPSHPFANFVADAERQGYKSVVNFRQIRQGGRLYRHYRLVVSKGPIRYETVFGADFLVPVTVVNTIGKSDNTRWSAVQWEFPKDPIKPSEIAFKRPAPAPKRAPTPLRPKASPSR